MGPGKLSGLRRRDRLELLSEVQVTVDCDKRSARCAGRPYDYDPDVVVTLELARRVRSTGTVAGDRPPQRRPAASACPTASTTARSSSTAPPGSASTSPAACDRCFANVVVSASSPQARGDQRMIIGSNKPNGRIVQNKSRLSAIRLAPWRDAPSACGPATCAASRYACARSARLVLSQKVEGLERGDVLAATAALRSDVRHLGYNALVGAELVVARGPTRPSPSRLVRRVGLAGGRDQPRQRHQLHAGPIAVRDPQGRGRQGAPRRRRAAPARRRPLFVNLVLRTKQKRVEREHGARLRCRAAPARGPPLLAAP